MLSTKRSKVRALAVIGMAGVVAGIGAVTFSASAAEQRRPAQPTPFAAPAAPAPFGPGAKAVSIPGIAAAIQPPTGSRPIGAYMVTSGTQNYTCVVPEGAATGAFPTASTPEAQLLGTGGKIHHFGGPSWQSLRDNSLVTAAKVGENPKTGTIPELLLQVKTHSGAGILDKADYISRLLTSGGVAPAKACTTGEKASVKYGAIYVFWDAP